MLSLTEKPEAVEIPKKKKCTPPPNPCTKTDKLLRLLEASHREDRRRLHEDDERGEEDVGDRRWLLRTIVFVGAACATFLALAPRPAFASVVAPIACLAGLEVCGICGPTCDAVCTH